MNLYNIFKRNYNDGDDYEENIERMIYGYKKSMEWGEIIDKYDSDWNLISLRLDLTEDFIREYKYDVYWELISKYSKLSEDFIREFEDYVHWYYISKYQNLSAEFKELYKDKLLISKL